MMISTKGVFNAILGHILYSNALFLLKYHIGNSNE